MQLLSTIQQRFERALEGLSEEPATHAALVRVAGNPDHGDYQANCALPLGKQRDEQPREIAAKIVENLDISDLCEPPEVAGPGFINLRLKNSLLQDHLRKLQTDERLGVETTTEPQKIVLDYSSPNVAKPMHVGHLRATCIGAALYNMLKFLGHDTIGDNHIGDWGTQFGMIIYGYRNFRDEAAYRDNAVLELARLYRLVNQIAGFHDAVAELPKLEATLPGIEAEIARLEAIAEPDKKTRKELKRARDRFSALTDETPDTDGNPKGQIPALRARISAVQEDADLRDVCEAHSNIKERYREETVKLHQGDPQNLALWNEFLPACLTLLDEIYDRLGVSFELTHGESHYHAMLADVVAELLDRNLAIESEGATIVPFENSAPFMIRKSDGAFTYATTDLATLKDRVVNMAVDRIIYVVGLPQAEHFQKLFETARRWGFDNVELAHVGFGSVLDPTTKRMLRTRAGDAIGLEGLLDEAVQRAKTIVETNSAGVGLGEEEVARVAEIVGMGGIKFADLRTSRESDYTFNWDQMLATQGDTAAYLQYAYARCCGIFRKGEIAPESLRDGEISVSLDSPQERALALSLARLEDALHESLRDYRPHLVAEYLLSLAKDYTRFFDACPVVKAETEELRMSRAVLCDLTARTLKLCLGLLGIEVTERM